MRVITKFFIFFLFLINGYGATVSIYTNDKADIFFIETIADHYVLVGYGGDDTGMAGVCGFKSGIIGEKDTNTSSYLTTFETDLFSYDVLDENHRFQIDQIQQGLQISHLNTGDFCSMYSNFNGAYTLVKENDAHYKNILQSFIDALLDTDPIKQLLIKKYKSLTTDSIIAKKQYLYNTSSPDSKTKMYLIKGDKVQILEEQTDKDGTAWVHILFKGKKEIRKWVPKSALVASE